MDNLSAYCVFETIPLKDDYEGKAVATLIIPKTNKGNRKSILFVHGFVDYFFHLHVIQKCDEQGYDVYGLDLRKYGRSLMEHQHPCFCKNLEEYFEELDYCINKIKNISNENLYLSGHSTGGLSTSLYMNYGNERTKVSGLILNAPFLELNLFEINNFQLQAFKLLYTIVPIFMPFAVLKNELPSVYGKSLHKNYNGEWDYNLDWKPIKGFPTFYTWFKAVTRGHKYLKSQSNIQVPILIMHSAKSLTKNWTKEDFNTTDVVLNVEHMRKIGPKLGKDVSFVEVNNALHDVFLSNKEAREQVFSGMFNWLKR